MPMETKKSEAADLERGRVTGFLLGLVFALSLLFVAFEYTTDDGTAASDGDELDNLLADAELTPVRTYEDMVALTPVAKAPSLDRVRAADEAVTDERASADGASAAEAMGLLPFVPSDDDAATSLATIPPQEAANPLNFRVVRELPQFPGGPVEMMKWLTRNLKYPPSARQRKQQGKVKASFIINLDGSISDIKIVESAGAAFDREAMRVIRMMPRWKAGVQDGKPCRTMVCVPIVFKL